tara:strand:+ start:15791 stop:15898 length:108 start_codon:yes stop_codon:yes gene_type:complete
MKNNLIQLNINKSFFLEAFIFFAIEKIFFTAILFL